MTTKVNKFRAILAEQGIEMTPDQAERTYKMASKIRKTAKRLSVKDLWEIEENENIGMTKEERSQIVELYRSAKDI